MDYAGYVEHQSRVNEAKFGLTSLTADEVRAVSDYFAKRVPDRLADERFFAVCQGIRNGAEIRAFARRLGRRVIGTDISISVLQVPDGFLCDFGDCPALWRGKVDLLYSNSYDHSPDLDSTLAVWKRLLAPRGLLFLQYTPAHGHDTGLSLEEVAGKLEAAGFSLEAILDIEPRGGIAGLLDRCRNVLRQLVKRLARLVVPRTSSLYWSLGYNLRHGPLVETRVLVAKG
ncbi:MAG: hypothetical protein ACREDZ_15875 [Kiloniellales bacterium]